MTYKLNQPNNQLINHLGDGSFALVSQVAQRTLKALPPLTFLFFSKLFHILLTSGYVFARHPFVNNMFFEQLTNLSMPVDFSANFYTKFYRVMRLRDSIDPRGRKLLIMRKTMRTLNITNLGIYRRLDAILLTIVVALPVPFKRLGGSQLSLLKTRTRSSIAIIGGLTSAYRTALNQSTTPHPLF